MSQFKVVCIVFHMCLIMVIFKEVELYGQIQFLSPDFVFTFNDSLFLRFFDCMVHQYKSCTGIIDYNYWSSYRVIDILHSNDKVTKPEPYTCYLYYNISTDYSAVQCLSQEQRRCRHFSTDCISSYRVLVLKTENFFISGDSIDSCYNSCSDQTFYYRVVTTTTSTTLPTTTTRTTSSTIRTTFSSSTLSTIQSTNATQSLVSSTIKTLHENSSVNVSGITSNNDKTDENTSATIIISASVVSTVCLVIVSIIGILFWRRNIIKKIKNHTDTKLEKHDVNSKNVLNSPCDGGNERVSNITEISGEPPDLLKTGHKHPVQVYSNCVVEGEYTSIEGGENNSTISTSLDCKTNIGTYNVVETDSEMLNNRKRAYVTDNSTVNTIREKSFQNNNSNNTLYNNTAEKASSEYQRLGQERRDLKNPYQQLLQVEQEQQLVLSDQELFPYTLAKPVLGEAILQIIDVGACVDNSTDRDMTREDQHYNNTLEDVFTPQHEPIVDIKHDRLGYTMVLHKQ